MLDFIEFVAMLKSRGDIPKDTAIDIHRSYEVAFAVLLAVAKDRDAMFSQLDTFSTQHLGRPLTELPHQKGLTK